MSFKFQNKAIPGFTTVVIPSYNEPIGLKETLLSLKAQTLPADKFEIIVVNDGADPRQTAVCKEMSVKCIEVSPNMGSYTARNTAISASRGEKFALIDSDMKAIPEWLEIGTKLLDEYHYAGGSVPIEKDKLKSSADYYEYLIAFDFKNSLLKNHYIGTGNLFVRREVFEEVGVFLELRKGELQSGADSEFGKRVYAAKKFSMHYEESLIAYHPPRGRDAIIKKYARTTQGTLDLAKSDPVRFKQFRFGVRRLFESLLYPAGRVLKSKRPLNPMRRIQAFIWASFFGIRCAYTLVRLAQRQSS